MSDTEPYRVVIADDVAALRNLIKIGLERSERFKVVDEAGTGLEAIAAAAKHHPDLVLLDLSMPEMDGLEALPRVLEASPASRVAVLSGFNHVRMGPVALRMGASAYLEKGLQPKSLVEELLRVLEPTTAAPAAPAPTPPDVAPPPATGTVSAASNLPPGQLRVLMLLKDRNLVKKMSRILNHATGRSFSLQTAPDLDSQSAAIRAGMFDLILIDAANSPDEAERSLVDVLSAASTTPVVLVLPSGADPNVANGALKLGVEDCLASDRLDPDVVVRSLLYAVERRRVHEARVLARENAREIARFRELERLKTQFFNTAAHELGTPLTPIRLQLHMLKMARPGVPLTGGQLKSIEILDRNVERLSRLTQDLLDVARLQSGRINLQQRPADVAPLLRDVVESFEPVAVAQGVHLELGPVQAMLLDIDAKRMTQVFYNLVSNALKFTPAGGRVWIDSVDGPNELQVRVHDSGEGLTHQQIERLFQPFSQVHPNPERNRQGTGLGLYVSRGIVDLHGGRIWCESDGPGRGSTFALALPKKARTVPAALLDEPPLIRRRESAVANQPRLAMDQSAIASGAIKGP